MRQQDQSNGPLMTERPRAEPRSDHLDAVRGVAISMILVRHLWDPFPGDTRLGLLIAQLIDPLMSLSWTGVDLFFVLSGYLIAGSLIDNRDASNYFPVFYGRRTVRILPLYIILLAAAAASGTLLQPLAHLTFTQNYAFASQPEWGTLMTRVTWSLAVEEQFYLILPLIVRFMDRRYLPYIFCAMIAIAPVSRLLIGGILGNIDAAYLFLPCRMDGLFMGALLAWAMRDQRAGHWLHDRSNLLIPAAMILAVGYCGLLVFSPDQRDTPMWSLGFTWCSGFYATLLALVVRLPRAAVVPGPLRVLCWLGVRAYAIYLFHLPIVLALKRSGLSEHGLRNSALTMILVAIAAYLSWQLLEAPLIEWGRIRFRYRSR